MNKLENILGKYIYILIVYNFWNIECTYCVDTLILIDHLAGIHAQVFIYFIKIIKLGYNFSQYNNL